MDLRIGENIRKHRRDMNLSQEVLAERLGVSFQAVSKWENESALPDILIMPKLADYFGREGTDEREMIQSQIKKFCVRFRMSVGFGGEKLEKKQPIKTGKFDNFKIFDGTKDDRFSEKI